MYTIIILLTVYAIIYLRHRLKSPAGILYPVNPEKNVKKGKRKDEKIPFIADSHYANLRHGLNRLSKPADSIVEYKRSSQQYCGGQLGGSFWCTVESGGFRYAQCLVLEL